jgi:hypothetical protein
MRGYDLGGIILAGAQALTAPHRPLTGEPFMNRLLPGLLVAAVLLVPATVRAADDKAQAPEKAQVLPPPATRPSALPPLYVSLAALQAYDGYSTLHGLNQGARESNVLVGGLAGKPALFWAVKGGSTAVSIFMAEQLWRHHRRAEAIVTMVAANGVMAVIAARNASVLRASR